MNSSGAMPMGSASSRTVRPRRLDPVHAARRAEEAQHGVAEVLQVAVRVEGDVVGARASPAAAPRAAAGRETRSDGGKGMWRKKPTRTSGAASRSMLRQEHQLVVVHPDEVAGPELVEHRLAEEPVGLDVSVPVGGVEAEERREVVEERPERLVREALVEAARHLGREVHGDVALAPDPLRENLPAARVRDAGLVAVPTDPQPFGLTQNRPHRRGEAACALLHLPGVAAPPQGVRQAVRDHDHAVIALCHSLHNYSVPSRGAVTGARGKMKGRWVQFDAALTAPC